MSDTLFPRIIQIAGVPNPEGSYPTETLYGLDTEGNLWEKTYSGPLYSDQWELVIRHDKERRVR